MVPQRRAWCGVLAGLIHKYGDTKSLFLGLLALSGDADETVRHAAVMALGDVVDVIPKARDTLHRIALEDENEAVREEARSVLACA